MKHYLKRYGIGLLILALGLWTAGNTEAANSVGPYVSSPIFMTNAVPPNVLIIFDNSGSMNSMAYWQEGLLHDDETPGEFDIVPATPYSADKNYYGYFVAGTPGNRVYYTYASNKFQRDPNGEWEGNFLNWLCMRRVDVARKVLVGGLATSRTGGGNTTLIAEDPAQWGRSYKCKLEWSLLELYTPFGGDTLNRYVGLKDGYLYVSQDLNTSPFDKFDYQYSIQVQRDVDYCDTYDPANPNCVEETFDFHDGNIAGVMQKVGDKAYWGLEFFRNGTGSGNNGGYIKNRVGHPTITNLYTNIENEAMGNWTPLAESFYVAMQYFKQEPIDPSLASLYNPGYQINSSWDPYDQDGNSTHCAKTFVLLFTDGSSTKDMLIPDAYKTYDGDPNDPNTQAPAYVSEGSDYLDDIALHARVNDLRPDLEGDQNIELFVVYAFGDDPAARRLLKDSSRNGGFIEKNGNNRPDPATGTVVDVVDYTTPVVDDSWSEWWEDKRASADGSALPDTYFEAQDGWKLEQELINAITKILERANSGTAVSVLATSGEGEGALYQAYFRPKSSTATEEVHWTGYLQGLWIDAHGNLREDAGVSGKLELGADPIVTFFYEKDSGETLFKRRLVSGTDKYGTQSPPTTHSLTELNSLWEAGSLLAERSAASRTIYTFVDLDGEGDVDGKNQVDTGEFIYFTTGNQGKLQRNLDLAEDTGTAEIEFSYLGVDEPTRVVNLISYIRGVDSASTRNRTLGSKVYKLGDIVHSTPTPVGRPVDNYDLIYKDETYKAFYLLHKDRETVVYTAANDGMLHAFLAGVFKPGDKFTGDNAEFIVDTTKYPSLNPGDEIWAYIPQNLLPHLKWLADPAYMDGTHVYYVDLKPRIFDARIYEGADDSSHPLHDLWTTGMNAEKRDLRPYGWCTVLVGGMRFGGGPINVNADWKGTGSEPKTFSSSYFALDVTDPKNPILLWELDHIDYPGLGFTTSFPAVLKVEERSITLGTPDTVNVLGQHWYLLFGSGPTTYDGTSAQSSRVFLVDLASGRTDLASNPGRIFTHLTDSDGINIDGSPLPNQSFMGSPVSIDLSLDYSVNVSYFGETHETNQGPGGGLYRLQVPTDLEFANNEPVLLYDVKPETWVLSQMFDAQRPITAGLSAAIGTADSGYSLWLHFGTGRYMSAQDKTDTTTEQYLFGVKDPYYNSLLDTTDRDTLLSSEPFTKDDLFETTAVKVYTDGTVTGTGTPEVAATFAELKIMQDFGSTYEVGWYKALDSSERIVSKPSVLGGILLAPSFVPNQDICAFGGDSYLHALYFETGTAYVKSVVGVAADDSVKDKIKLGVGISSSLGIHVGREQGARGFIQQSTGSITQIDLKPAFNIKSGFMNWREVR
jgi:type IV pilus assembly protein PilY1